VTRTSTPAASIAVQSAWKVTAGMTCGSPARASS
jgi:hypothetical protein